MAESRYKVLDVLDQLAPELRDAFLESIADIRSSIQIAAVEENIASGNLEAAILALNLLPEFFQPFDTALRTSYLKGGVDALAGLPVMKRPESGRRVVVRFNGRNPRAESWISEASSRNITNVLEETKEAVRVRLAESMRRMVNPRTAALDIAGRYNRVTKRREGGVIGLTRPQERTQANLENVLRNNPRGYFIKDEVTGEWKPRFKFTKRTYDSVVLKAIKEGKPIPESVRLGILRDHYSNQLKYRGEVIARTEMLEALHAAQNEGFRQQIENGTFDREEVIRVWDSSADNRVRPSHSAMDGQRRKIDEPFITPSGYRLMYPGDSTSGAPASETIMCRCYVKVEVNFLERAL